MPKAIKGDLQDPYFYWWCLTFLTMAPSGVLVECDPSIKAIILKIDQDKHDYIVEDLDDQTLVIKENRLSSLKARLEEELSNTQQMPEDSGSD
ncbi:TFIIH complex subunit tfb5 [Trapelia coarctata]|nr:TFIIH complex subunit tfb5 [Trapelia coarctata]